MAECYVIEGIFRDCFGRVFIAVVSNEKRKSLLPDYYVDIPDKNCEISGIAAVPALGELYEEYRKWISGERKTRPEYEFVSMREGYGLKIE